MQIKDAKYEVTAVKPEQYPKHRLAEVAMVGRSNVGKSSMINALLNRKNLARESATPGKTREINFYSVNQAFYLVDLPGYGFARVSKDEKERWTEMIETYLNTREQLQLILMIVDIRHAPSNEDQMMYDWLKSGSHPFLVVASKLDKISRSQIGKQQQLIRETLGMSGEDLLISFSAETKQGRDEVWRGIEAVLR